MLVFFERYASLSQIIWSPSLGLVVVLTPSSRVRAVCCFCSNDPVTQERFVLLLKLSSLFRAVCSSLTNSLVVFQRFAPVAPIPQFLSSGLLLSQSLSSHAGGLLCVFSNF